MRDFADLLGLDLPRPAQQRPLIVDSFAGGGGASTGIEMAVGRSPDIAINHSASALALHAANHPQTLHLSENVYKIDPLDHLRGKHIGLAWFSPDCKHFSKAKGGKPVERNIRDLCWIIPGWTERIQKSGGKIDVIIMENVEEFRDYGPLLETLKGLRPDPDRRGETFRKWCHALKRLGGRIEWMELRGCDYGAPTIRKRLFIIIRFDGKAIVWPEPTHGHPESPEVISGKLVPWPVAGEQIDYSLPCPSIFASSEEILAKHGLRAVRPLADNSMARIARGFERYVLRAQRPYLLNLTHGGRVEDVAEPLRTITCARRGEKALIAPVLTYAQHGGACRSMRDPSHTITASSKDQNALLCAWMAQHNTDGRRADGINPGRALDGPASTITSTGSQQNIVAAYVARDFGTATGGAMDEPLGTVMPGGGGGKSRLITSYLQSYYGQGEGWPADSPAHTVTTRDRFGHVEGALTAPPLSEAQTERARQVADFLREHGIWDEREFVTLEIQGTSFVVYDIGMRMLTPRELYNCQGFPHDYQIDGYFDESQSGPDGAPLWVPFSKQVQISCVGNSVCPPVAQALVAANCGHLVVNTVQEAAA